MKILEISSCSDCPFYEFDATNQDYDDRHVNQEAWDAQSQGLTAVCLKTLYFFDPKLAEKGVLANCPLEDKMDALESYKQTPQS